MAFRNIQNCTLWLSLFAGGIAWGQTLPQVVEAVTIDGITSTATVIDNRSVLRHSTVHTFCATGTGTWSVQLQYSDTSATTGFTNFPNAFSLVNNSASSCAGNGLGYHPWVRFLISGTASVSYRGTTGLYIVADLPSISAISFSAITSGTNTTFTAVVGTGASISYSGAGEINANYVSGVQLSGLATGLVKLTAGVPSIAVANTDYALISIIPGCVDTNNGVLCYDSSGNQLHTSINSTDRVLVYRASTTPTSGNCAQWGANGILGDAGAPCGSGSGSTAFSALTSSTNTTATMLVGSGATLSYSGTGSINSNFLSNTALSGLTGIAYFTAGVPSTVSGSAANCVLVNGTSTLCGGTGAGLGSITATTTLALDGGSTLTAKTFAVSLQGNVNSCPLSNFIAGEVVLLSTTIDATPGRTITCGGLTNLGSDLTDGSSEANKNYKQYFVATGSGALDSAGSPMWCDNCATNGIKVTGGLLALPPGPDTLLGAASTAVLTQKSFDSAGSGNTLKIASTTITGLSGTGGVLCTSVGSACSGGGGSVYAASQGPTANVAQTGSYVVIYSQASVPAMAAGACRTIEYAIHATTAPSTTVQLFVDNASIATLGNLGSSGYLRKGVFAYCNNAAVQNVQTITLFDSGYCVDTGCAGWVNELNPGNTALPATSAVTWTGTHTIDIRTNAASGNVNGLFLHIYD